MKKFAVLKKIDGFNANVVREFDTESDANAFAQLLQSSETKSFITYYVCQVLHSTTAVSA